MRKWLVRVGILILVAVVGLGAWLHVPTLIQIGPGYSADMMCGCVFISGRTPESCSRDLDPLAGKLVSVQVDTGGRSVTARAIGVVRRTARYRDGYGCGIEN
jgi:hypothetical protein